MKTKIYLKDWYFNAGIVGFLRILEKNENNFVEVKENYIEFDTDDLRNFHEYYFNYFYEEYNIARRTNERIDKSFDRIKNVIKNKSKDKEEEKKKNEILKSEKKYLKDILKTQLDKIKKYDNEIYEVMNEEYNKIDTIKEIEDIEILEKTVKVLKQNLLEEKINKRLSMNLFKSILSKRYFGQPSFLNVVKTSLSFEEQAQTMYKDYISNIVEMGFLQDISEKKYNLKEIQEYITNNIQEDLQTKEVISIYNNILKYIEKNKTLEEIQKYLDEKVFKNCFMCENEKTITSNYSESNFIPLAISSDNMRNFFWNQNASFPICDICKLLLFCIPAGITEISKTVKENGKYREKEMLSFVNYDTNVETLKKINASFSQKSRRDKSFENPYSELILDIVNQDKEISQWQLQNIFVVEFETEYLAFSRMEYFNISRYVARFFQSYSGLLNGIKDYRYKLQIVDSILKNRDIKYIINDRLRDELKEDIKRGFNSFLASRIRLTLNILKKEESEMEEAENIKKNNNKLTVLYNLGIAIHEELQKNNEENKLNGYTYKMLNSIKTGNKKEFMDIVIRIHMMMGKDVSPIFLEIMKESDLDFESIAHSFVSGLISNKYEKEENKEVV